MLLRIELNIPTTAELHSLEMEFFNALEKFYLFIEDKAFTELGEWFWQTMFLVTGKCGSHLNRHYPIYGNHHKWLWKATKRGFCCQVCHTRIKSSAHQGNWSARYLYLAKSGRQKDMEQLQLSLSTATNDAERKAVLHAMSKITHEETHVGAMREELIKATREGDHDKIKDIHEYIGTKRKYHNE